VIQNARIAVLFGDCDNGGASGSADYDNGIWQHTLNVQRVPLEKKMSDEQIALWCKANSIDVLLCTMWGTFIAGTGKNDRGVKTLKEYCKGLKVVGIVDEPLMVDVASRFGGNSQSMAISKGYVDGLADFDAIICLTEKEIEFYKSFNPNVACLGLPFPDDAYPNGGYSSLIADRLRPEKGSEIWVGLGVGGNAFTRWERNYLVACEAFNLAVEKARAIDPHVAESMRGVLLSWTEKTQLDVIDFFKTKYKNIKIQVRSDMRTYLHFLQSCDFVINPCLRDTPQRINGECSYFQIPFAASQFGSNVTDPVGEFDVEGFAQRCVDSIFCQQEDLTPIVEANKESLIKNFGREAMRAKFKAFMIECGILSSWIEIGDKNETFI